MQQVGTGPVIWWRADEPPAPRPVLKTPAARPRPDRPQRFWQQPLWRDAALATAVTLSAAAFLILGNAERRSAAVSEIERAAGLAGLGLQQVTLTGHRFTADSDIFDAIDLERARTLLTFDAAAAQARIERLPWIEKASIERIVPDRLEVRVTERAPFAVWRSGEDHFLIDRTGRVLQPVPADAMLALPRVAGTGAAGEVAALYALLAGHARIARRIELAERVGERRWTLRLAGGTTVHLPADGEAEALARLGRLFDAGLQSAGSIDLRVPARVLVRERT